MLSLPWVPLVLRINKGLSLSGPAALPGFKFLRSFHWGKFQSLAWLAQRVWNWVRKQSALHHSTKSCTSMSCVNFIILWAVFCIYCDLFFLYYACFLLYMMYLYEVLTQTRQVDYYTLFEISFLPATKFGVKNQPNCEWPRLVSDYVTQYLDR